MKNAYLVACLTYRKDKWKTETRHWPDVIVAKSRNEALGLAISEGQENYPASEGWSVPRVSIINMGSVQRFVGILQAA